MKGNVLKTLCAILDIIAILLTLIMIFGFSLQDVEKSNVSSGTVTEIIEEKVTPIKEAVEENKITRNQLEAFIRSLAHASEFALLGAEMMFLLLLLPLRPLKFTAYMPFFACLMLGVADECLQMTNDRSSEVIDVVKDFAGSIVGGALVLLIYMLVTYIKKKKDLTKSDI